MTIQNLNNHVIMYYTKLIKYLYNISDLGFDRKRSFPTKLLYILCTLEEKYCTSVMFSERASSKLEV